MDKKERKCPFWIKKHFHHIVNSHGPWGEMDKNGKNGQKWTEMDRNGHYFGLTTFSINSPIIQGYVI
jgi:hypothetical protein